MKRALDWALLQATVGGGGLCGVLLNPPSLQAIHDARAFALTLAQNTEAIRGVDGIQYSVFSNCCKDGAARRRCEVARSLGRRRAGNARPLGPALELEL